MALITYDDKVALNENPSIPNVNKVNASDMNQIKTGVNTNETNITTLQTTLTNTTTYSTTETVIGTWLGKPLYRKVVDFGNLPNNAAKTVNHYISNLDKVINIGGYCFDGSEVYYPIPLVYRGADSNYNVQISVEPSVIRMSSSTNRSQYNAYVVLEYTKTTD